MNKFFKTLLLCITVAVFGLFVYKLISKKSFSEIFNQQWNAQSYNKYAVAQFEIAMRALSSWHFKGTENVLDIGAGDGQISYNIAKKYVPNGTVLAIDISKDMVNFAIQKYKVKNLTFMAMNATEIQFQKQFDVVTSFYCIHWIQDKQKLFNGIANALKPEGKTLLYMMDCLDNCMLAKVLHQTLTMPKWAQYFKDIQIPWHFKTEQEFTEIVKNAGLKPIKVKATTEEVVFPSKDALRSWIKAIPLASHLPPDLHEAFFDDMEAHYLQYVPVNKDGTIKFGLPTMIVIAQKN